MVKFPLSLKSKTHWDIICWWMPQSYFQHSSSLRGDSCFCAFFFFAVRDAMILTSAILTQWKQLKHLLLLLMCEVCWSNFTMQQGAYTEDSLSFIMYVKFKKIGGRETTRTCLISIWVVIWTQGKVGKKFSQLPKSSTLLPSINAWCSRSAIRPHLVQKLLIAHACLTSLVGRTAHKKTIKRKEERIDKQMCHLFKWHI